MKVSFKKKLVNFLFRVNNLPISTSVHGIKPSRCWAVPFFVSNTDVPMLP